MEEQLLNLKKIWLDIKHLSGMLKYHDPEKYPRQAMSDYCQNIENDFVVLVAKISEWKRTDLETFEEKGVIDAHDKKILKRILPV